ncbi:MAG: CBS domain-containing protein [Betaproteobacteria bacterium]
MLVRDIMTRNVRVASPDDDLQSAAAAMKQDDFGVLPVVERERLVGMLTDRDIAVRAVARGLSPVQSRVREIMSVEVEHVHDDDSAEDAARVMSQMRVRRLPVLDHDDHLVGILSLGDLAISRPEPAGAVLNSISQPG